jgi:hypothetical protein
MSTTFANGTSNTPTINGHRKSTSILEKVLTANGAAAECKEHKKNNHLSASDALRTKVTLKNNQQMTCLSLIDNDCLKTPTVPDLMKTPTTLGSPSKSVSALAHADELNTPSLCMNSCTPKNQPQAFFGDHEPLLTGKQK